MLCPQDDADPEVGREPLATDQGERGQRAQNAADAQGRVQQADSGVTSMQQLERGDDDEYADRAGDERLGRVQTDDDTQAAVAGDRREAAGGLAQ